jgi:tight adherence protein B
MRLLEESDKLTGSSFGFKPLLAVIRRRLSQAYPSASLGKFLTICFVLAAVGAIAAWVITDAPLMALLVGGALGYFPFFVVSKKRASWQRAVTAQLPEALDFLSRVLRAGQSMATGLQMMSEELTQPLATEFGRCYDQHGLGQPIEECLRDMALRLESQDFAFFVTAVVIQRQSGGDLAEVLGNISNMVRQRLRLQQAVRAKTAEGRFTGYIMVAFPVVMFFLSYILNPERGALMLHTSQGKMLLLAAGGMVAFGLFLIKRITTVTV